MPRQKLHLTKIPLCNRNMAQNIPQKSAIEANTSGRQLIPLQLALETLRLIERHAKTQNVLFKARPQRCTIA